MGAARNRLAALAFFVAVAPAVGHAGRTCATRPPDVETERRSMALAERTARSLDASGAQVAIIARAGQDLSRYGLSWSHMAFAYRERPGSPWRVVHKLNHCGTATGALYR